MRLDLTAAMSAATKAVDEVPGYLEDRSSHELAEAALDAATPILLLAAAQQMRDAAASCPPVGRPGLLRAAGILRELAEDVDL